MAAAAERQSRGICKIRLIVKKGKTEMCRNFRHKDGKRYFVPVFCNACGRFWTAVRAEQPVPERETKKAASFGCSLLLSWCRGRELNSHGVATATSRQRVYQFHHPDTQGEVYRKAGKKASGNLQKRRSVIKKPRTGRICRLSAGRTFPLSRMCGSRSAPFFPPKRPESAHVCFFRGPGRVREQKIRPPSCSAHALIV